MKPVPTSAHVRVLPLLHTGWKVRKLCHPHRKTKISGARSHTHLATPCRRSRSHSERSLFSLSSPGVELHKQRRVRGNPSTSRRNGCAECLQHKYPHKPIAVDKAEPWGRFKGQRSRVKNHHPEILLIVRPQIRLIAESSCGKRKTDIEHWIWGRVGSRHAGSAQNMVTGRAATLPFMV